MLPVSWTVTTAVRRAHFPFPTPIPLSHIFIYSGFHFCSISTETCTLYSQTAIPNTHKTRWNSTDLCQRISLRLLWPWPITFWSQKLIIISMNPNTLLWLKLGKIPLIKPPDIVCRRTYILPRFLYFFFSSFVSYSISSLNGTQPYPATWSEVSVIWKCMSEIWGITSPTNRGPKNHLFGLRNSTATLTAYIFRTKHDIDNRSSMLTTTSGLLHRLKTIWTLVHKWLQIGSKFSPTVRKFCILHCQASQTEISKRNSATLCQTVSRKKVGFVYPEKMGAKNFYICSVFRRLRDLMVNICWTKRDIDNQARALESTKALLRCRKNFMNFGPQTA